MRVHRASSPILTAALALFLVGQGACKNTHSGSSKSPFPGLFPSHGAAAAPQGIVGHWKSSTETLDFDDHGSVAINGVPYTYTVNGSILKVDAQNTTASYPYTLEGNTLTVTLNGQPVVYTRVVETAPPAPSASTATTSPTAAPTTVGPPPAPGPGPGPAPAPAPTGTILTELVGKWCFMSNVYANDGGRQSNTCFALNGDGTYSYHSETSSSGQYGGTASQSDDQGHWVASGNTLTASSNTGKVTSYTFEKQNHPKTRDPMLIVNGQTFVTYFQKPSW